jgi:hypothetical protein
LTSVLLPEPLGAEMMKRMPAMFLSFGQWSVVSGQWSVVSGQWSNELSASFSTCQENF